MRNFVLPVMFLLFMAIPRTTGVLGGRATGPPGRKRTLGLLR
jgi:hypothetical protein